MVMRTKTALIAVYGTLRKGQGNHHLLAHASFVGHAKTVACMAMRCTQIPFVSQAQQVSQIAVELYEVGPAVLARIDALEGYIPSAPERSWYQRIQVEVEDAAGQVRLACLYVNESDGELVPHGDFTRRRTLPAASADWYFAYGSNMNPERMTGRGVYFNARLAGVLPNHRLAYNKQGNSGQLFANADRAEGQQCRGLLYRLDRAGLRRLDGCEGAPVHYVRERRSIEVPGGSAVEAWVYFATPAKITCEGTPSAAYRSHLLRGRDVWGEVLQV